jgi:hypothetical protein
MGIGRYSYLHDELPHRITGDPTEDSRENRRNQTGNPSKNFQCPGLSHDGKAYLVPEKKDSTSLPRHGPILDIAGLFFGSKTVENVGAI